MFAIGKVVRFRCIFSFQLKLNFDAFRHIYVTHHIYFNNLQDIENYVNFLKIK